MAPRQWHLLLITSKLSTRRNSNILCCLQFSLATIQSLFICLWRLLTLYLPSNFILHLSYCCYLSACSSFSFLFWYVFFQVCKIIAGQRYTKMLNGRQVTEMLRATCQRPHEREQIIKNVSTCQIYQTWILFFSKLVAHVFLHLVFEWMVLLSCRLCKPTIIIMKTWWRTLVLEFKVN